jgi:hypothetical protein
MTPAHVVLALAVGLLAAVTGATLTTILLWRALTKRGRVR